MKPQQENIYNDISISTFIINLKERTERLVHIQQQFSGRPEFTVKIIEACKHKIGAVGLWQSIVNIIKIAIEQDDDVIIISEDDHQFTSYYNKEYLLKNIIEANEQGALILSGGNGGFGSAVPLTENRFWVNTFLSTQFIVLYKDIFQKIIDFKFKKSDVADRVMSEITSHKMLLYPFISEQKDFGYSDVTDVHNEVDGLVSTMFYRTSERLRRIQEVYLKYKKTPVGLETSICYTSHESVNIPYTLK